MVNITMSVRSCFFFFQAEDGIRDKLVTGVQTCALPIYLERKDRLRHDDEHENAAEQRQGDAPELLPPGGPVDPGGLVEHVRNAFQAGHEEIGRASCRERV